MTALLFRHKGEWYSKTDMKDLNELMRVIKAANINPKPIPKIRIITDDPEFQEINDEV